MHVVHLTASPFFGGPERQLLGLARALSTEVRSTFYSFPEGGLCRPFLDVLARHGLEGHALEHNSPRLPAMVREVAGRLHADRADILCCHGYKADLAGLLAGRRAGVPVVMVSRGWTGATWKVRLYEALDRRCLRFAHHVVCVSEGQAAKVRRTGVSEQRLSVIRNAIDVDRFGNPDKNGRAFLQAFFPEPPKRIIGAAGRLSPEKGFCHLVDAAARIVATQSDVGFIVFGDGPLRSALERQIEQRGLRGRFILAGFRDDLDRWLPSLDVAVLPSLTEGLPNAVLEAFAAGVPVVATAVGGTPEVIVEGRTGYLVPPGQDGPLAHRLSDLLRCERTRRDMGWRGRERIRAEFTFAAQAAQYETLFAELVARTARAQPVLAGASEAV